MAFIYKKILQITTIPTDSSALFTVTTETKVYIRLIVIHNSYTAAEAVKLWIVPNGGSVGDTNEIFNQNMNPGETVILFFDIPGIILDTAGDAIHGDTTTASKVTIQIMGATE